MLHSWIHPVLGYHCRIWVSNSVGWIYNACGLASKRASCLIGTQEISILPRLVDCHNWGVLLEFDFLQGWPTLGVVDISSGGVLLDTFLGWEQILKGLSLRLVDVTDQRVVISWHIIQHLVRIKLLIRHVRSAHWIFRLNLKPLSLHQCLLLSPLHKTWLVCVLDLIWLFIMLHPLLNILRLFKRWRALCWGLERQRSICKCALSNLAFDVTFWLNGAD